MNSAIADEDPAARKSLYIPADPSMVQNLHSLSVDLVSLANNHVYDYGADALIDTLDTLSGAGIPYAGAGIPMPVLEEILRKQKNPSILYPGA